MHPFESVAEQQNISLECFLEDLETEGMAGDCRSSLPYFSNRQKLFSYCQ